jgi:hypothetical protein
VASDPDNPARIRAPLTVENGNSLDFDGLMKLAETHAVRFAKVYAQQPIAVTGYAQVGISGLSKVQAWVQRNDEELPPGDRYFAKAPWRDADILPAPATWGGGLPGDVIPFRTMGFDAESRRPKTWPMRLAKAHWAALLPGLSPGEYTFRCRTIDEKGQAQPMPRPFRKSGHSAIEQAAIVVKA